MLVVSAAAGWETLWRARGFEPTISEDVPLWSLQREKAVEGGSEAVAVIGSSRVKVGIVPEALAEATGWRRPVQLAIVLTSPLLVLENLATDPRFGGLVIVDVAPIILFNAFWPEVDPMARAYLQRHASRRWSQGIETRLSVLAESTFVFRLPQLSGNQLPDVLHRREGHAAQRDLTDRSRVTRLNDEVIVREAPPAPPKDSDVAPMAAERLGALVAGINRSLGQLHSHGGRAVFVQMPAAGAMGDFERRLFPRDRYWDVFAAGVDAPAVNAEDHGELSRFVPIDGSHLSSGDAVAFSRALGELLVRVLADADAPRAASAR